MGLTKFRTHRPSTSQGGGTGSREPVDKKSAETRQEEKMLRLKTEAIKLASNNEFISYYLAKYSKEKGFTKENMIEFLKCSEESYYELAVHRIPLLENGTYLVKTKVTCICQIIGCEYNSLYSLLESTFKEKK